MNLAEISRALKSREPVIHKCRVSLKSEMIEYAYISAMIVRYDDKTGRCNIAVELMDKNKNAVIITDAANVYRKSEIEKELKGGTI